MSVSTDLYLGCISGTSVDGLDIALLEVTSEDLRIGAATTAELPADLRDDLLKLANPTEGELDLLGFTDAALGTFIGRSLERFIADHSLDRSRIAAIGSHGQTVRHRPEGRNGSDAFTLQIGDPNRIAEITGIRTVADFRRRDMAAEGQGAPLVPPFHHALFANKLAHDKTQIILNVGGISNISVLHPGVAVTGFDTGPGNGLMDLWCQKHGRGAYDDQGLWGSTGNVQRSLLDAMLADPYFALPAPKSTGREYFNAAWLDRIAQAHPEVPAADMQATLCELTARATTDAIAEMDVDTIVVCGGGRLNRHLLARLRANSAKPVATSDEFSIDGDAIEAAAFAWFAHRTLVQQPANEPAVTGALGYRILGAVYAP